MNPAEVVGAYTSFFTSKGPRVTPDWIGTTLSLKSEELFSRKARELSVLNTCMSNEIYLNVSCERQQRLKVRHLTFYIHASRYVAVARNFLYRHLYLG